MMDPIIPDPLDTDTQYYRYYHYDIPNLDTDELQDEWYFLRVLLWGLSKDHWIRERVRILEKELKQRKLSK